MNHLDHITEPALRTFLAQHGPTLQPLLAPLWPLNSYQRAQYSDQFTKYTLGEMPDGRWAHLHHFTGPDQGAPHNHPCHSTSHVIVGSYVERIFHPHPVFGVRIAEVLRRAGENHTITAEHIHKIIALPEGECWTLAFTGSVVRQWQHFPELEPLVPTSEQEGTNLSACTEGCNDAKGMDACAACPLLLKGGVSNG